MPKDNSKPTRERRAREAQERQAGRDARSTNEHLNVLLGRVGSGGARREVARLKRAA